MPVNENNYQFPMYRVIPAAPWQALRENPGITARALTQLTTQMRLILFSAMQDAVVETNRTARMRSRRGAIFRQIMSGLRPRGYRQPATVSVTFMMRPWIAIHETGGTITPTSTKYMTLPMPAALRVDGRLKRRNAAGWRDYGTFVYTSKRGNKFIVYKNRNTGRLVFLYHLVDRVVMKKRLFLRQAILNQESIVVNAWTAAMMEIFNGIDLYGVAFQGMRIE